MQHSPRATFDAHELAVVLSYYDLGVIESVTELGRGSHRSPKVGIVAERGKFLLKRRSIERAHPDRVRFIHRVQHHLILADFPLAPLIPTRDRHQTWVQLREHIYELFQFMPGQTYSRTIPETRAAGASLAAFHHASASYTHTSTLTNLGTDYHDAPGARTGLRAIGSTLSSHDSLTGNEAELASLTQHLLQAYDAAADTVNRMNFNQWPPRLIHSDWHPGNLLFRNDSVLAVIDYDAMRFSRRIIDVANGALHFSILAGDDPAHWPDDLDMDRYRAFLDGYDSFLPAVHPPSDASLEKLRDNQSRDRLPFTSRSDVKGEGAVPDDPRAEMKPAIGGASGHQYRPPTADHGAGVDTANPAIPMARPVNLIGPLTAEERQCLPHLMSEALIAECVAPIAATGSMGRWSGFRVLQMVRRKLKWISEHHDVLTAVQ